ncbi:CHAT domain-containing protein [Flavobacterium aquicola]|uniref:CHAT domain-containing protein n=1 Tax=Flavobacterium aquicola TaxID=1682742 RepID=A0A3E0EGG2_9FLAO|nr:CHAT domain-containing protein [Flavobacterium aquicola]REG96369.1 CHAT domain-containing protein [Flavobacterium aquicola]
MIKKSIFLYLFTIINLYGQKKLPEDLTYDAIDYFVASPSLEGIKKLNSVETLFWKSQDKKTKEGLLSIVVLNCNKGYYENKFGRTNQAIASYEKAWKTYQTYQLTDYDIIEYCLKPLGNLYTIIGDYTNAENTIKHYYFIANVQKNEPQKIAAILNLSNTYQNSGRITEAIDLIENTIQTEKLTSVQKGLLLNNLGANYLLRSINEDTFNAEVAFSKAIPLLKQDKTQTEALFNIYINLYRIKMNSQKNEALNYFAKAKNIFESLPDKEPRKKAQFYLEEVILLLKQNNLAEAQTVLQKVFKILISNYSKEKKLPEENSLYAESVLLDALDLQADLFTAQKQPEKALKSYDLAFRIEKLFQLLIVYENSKIITQIKNRKRIEKCIQIYQSLFKKEGNPIYIEKAFQLVEHTKSCVLKNEIFRNQTASKNEKQKVEDLRFWNNEILKEQQKGELANINKINEAIKKQNVAMLILKEYQPSRTKQSNTVINVNALYSKLESDDAVMVEYFWGSQTVYVFTVQNKKITLQSFCTGQMCGEPIVTYVSLFNNANSITNDISFYNKTAALAYKNLLLPTKSSNKNLIIIPDGILNFLPFEALITKESNTTNFEKMHYLLNDFNIAYNNSASFYLDTKPFSQKEKTVLGIFPVFEKTNYTLTYSKKELQSIRNSFKGRFFENSDAAFQNFKNNAAKYSILHLSTHASAGDIETPASIKFYDREVMYSELYHLNIHPNLVVLSACETGIGKLYKSEGAMSIARGFQFAGAQNLLFSLWKVNDYTTSVFMGDFYKHIKKNESYFEANANAKLGFLKNKNISNAKKSPYYWASFVYYGDIENKEKNNYLLIGFVITAVVISCFIIYRLTFKRIKKEKIKFKNQ